MQMESKQEQKSNPKKSRVKPPVPDLDTLRNADLVPATYYHLRYHLFNRDSNGLSKRGAVVKFGSRVLIVPKLFREWVQAGGSASAKKGKRS
jgi:hypothetical protein